MTELLESIKSKYENIKVSSSNKLYYNLYQHMIRLEGETKGRSKIKGSKYVLFSLRKKIEEACLSLRTRIERPTLQIYTNDLDQVLGLFDHKELSLITQIKYMPEYVSEAYQLLAEDTERKYFPNTKHIVSKEKKLFRYKIFLSSITLYKIRREDVTVIDRILEILEDQADNKTVRLSSTARSKLSTRSFYGPVTIDANELDIVTLLTLVHGALVAKVEEYVAEEEITQ